MFFKKSLFVCKLVSMNSKGSPKPRDRSSGSSWVLDCTRHSQPSVEPGRPVKQHLVHTPGPDILLLFASNISSGIHQWVIIARVAAQELCAKIQECQKWLTIDPWVSLFFPLGCREKDSRSCLLNLRLLFSQSLSCAVACRPSLESILSSPFSSPFSQSKLRCCPQSRVHSLCRGFGQIFRIPSHLHWSLCSAVASRTEH